VHDRVEQTLRIGGAAAQPNRYMLVSRRSTFWKKMVFGRASTRTLMPARPSIAATAMQMACRSRSDRSGSPA